MKRKKAARPKGTISLKAIYYSNTILPDWLMVRDDLNLTEKIIYARLVRYQGHNKFAWPAIETLAKDCGMSRATIKRCFVRLEKVGVLKKERTGRTSKYYLNQEPGSTAYEWIKLFVESVSDGSI